VARFGFSNRVFGYNPIAPSPRGSTITLEVGF
jgi:hypothetical protein